MNLTHLTSAHKQGFRGKPLHKKREQKLRTIVYLKQKSSFLIAAISLVAFAAGNLIGTHGVHAVMASVFGKYDDSLISYTGTVTPISVIPDYEAWAKAGGMPEHGFAQVPKNVLIPLPVYDPAAQRKGDHEFEIGYMGSYKTGADGTGSHPGVDIRAPKGTPVRSIANGIVTSVKDDGGGFGKYIAIRHPHMPDPENPQKTTVLWSAYAHLDAQFVQEGDIVQKGQQIGLVGSTGYATGNHLHFQIDRDVLADGSTIPWHPYWPFSGQEARDAGLSLAQAIDVGFMKDRGYATTVSPLLYVQANYSPVKETVAAGQSSSASSSLRPLTTAERAQAQSAKLLSMRQSRLQHRLARRGTQLAAATPEAAPIVIRETTVASGEIPAAQPAAAVIPVPTPETPAPTPAPSQPSGDIRTIEIQHPATFGGRGWMTVTVTLRDADGNIADGSKLPRDMTLRTAYGEAEFRPQVLSQLDFHDGRAEVKVLPRGRKTIVFTVQLFGVEMLSEPMAFEGER